MKAFKRFTTGFNSKTFKGIGYLISKSLMKQIVLWVFIGLFLLLTFVLMSEYSSMILSPAEGGFDGNIFSSYAHIIIFGTIMPLFLITSFSIPGTLNNIHRSTMIKRIGATELTEQSYIFIIWIWYLIIDMILILILFSGSFMLTYVIFGNISLSIVWLYAILFSMILVITFVSIGVFLGTIPMPPAATSALCTFLFILSLLFGGVIMVVTKAITYSSPTLISLIIILNPIGISTYVMNYIFIGDAEVVMMLLICAYLLMISALAFFGASLIMKFNKIK